MAVITGNNCVASVHILHDGVMRSVFQRRFSDVQTVIQNNDVSAHFAGGTFWLGRSTLSNVRRAKNSISP